MMWLLAGLWHMLIMSAYYATATPEGVAREEPMMQFIVIGYLVLGLLMAYIYPKGYAGGAPLTEGVKFGVAIGLLWVLPHGLVMYGVHQIGTGALLVVDSLWHVAEQGAGGAVIGLIYSRMATPEPATTEA